jgi:hypothetical protein
MAQITTFYRALRGLASLIAGDIDTLWLGSLRQRWSFTPGAGESAFQFLLPVSYIAGGPITIEHPQRSVANIRKLVENSAGDIHGLAGSQHSPLFPQASFAGPLKYKVDFFLFLVVPGDLSAIGLQRDLSDGKIMSLNGGGSAHQVLSAAPGGESPALDLVQISNNHYHFSCY